jgi:hypothetical protein
MVEKEKLRIILTEKGDAMILDILKNHGLEESDAEYFNKSIKGQEPRFMIIRAAAITILQKKIPEQKLIELLEEHLEIPKNTAEKILSDTKEKILPELKIYPDEQFNDPDFREKVSQEIFGSETQATSSEIKTQTDELIKKLSANKNIVVPQPLEQKKVTYIKKAPVTNVEKNAQDIQKSRQNVGPQRDKTAEQETKKFGDEKFTNETKGPDTYREPIE